MRLTSLRARSREKLQTALARKLFPGKNFPTPLHIKKTLEDELIDNNVQFLYSSYVTNVLTDPSGKPAGVVIANRSGRQAIRCKAIIDATHNASVAGLLGAERKPFYRRFARILLYRSRKYPERSTGNYPGRRIIPAHQGW